MNAINAGARKPLVYVYAASNTNEIASAIFPSSAANTPPSCRKTTFMPTSCKAMYGRTARTPVTAIASSSQRSPKRSLTKSAAVM